MHQRLDAADGARKKSLRLWAWRSTFEHGRSEQLELAETFDCARDCQRADGSWNHQRRAARCCTLTGLPPVEFKPDARELLHVERGNFYRGRYGDRRLIGKTIIGPPIADHTWRTPPEDPADGCPGAWYRTPLIDEIDRASRRRTQDGGRVPNPRFEAAPELVQDAVLYLEDEEARWHASLIEERNRRAREEAKRREAEAERNRRRRHR